MGIVFERLSIFPCSVQNNCGSRGDKAHYSQGEAEGDAMLGQHWPRHIEARTLFSRFFSGNRNGGPCGFSSPQAEGRRSFLFSIFCVSFPLPFLTLDPQIFHTRSSFPSTSQSKLLDFKDFLYISIRLDALIAPHYFLSKWVTRHTLIYLCT